MQENLSMRKKHKMSVLGKNSCLKIMKNDRNSNTTTKCPV